MTVEVDTPGAVAAPDPLASLPLCRVATIPRSPRRDEDTSLDEFLERRRAALIASFFAQDDGGIVVAWTRPGATATASIFVGGEQLVGRAGSDVGTASVLLPPGTMGEAVEASVLRSLLDKMSCWTRIEVAEAVRAGAPDNAPENQRPLARSLEDAMASVWPHPYALLVHARPLPPTEIIAEAKRVQRELQGMGTQRSAEYEVNRERAETRYRELRRAAVTGLWRMALLAGASDSRRSRQLAALVAATIDVGDLPYVLTPTSTIDSHTEALSAASREGAAEEGMVPWATTDLLATIARPPIREIPGIRMVAPPTFDVTPESGGDIDLGALLDGGLADVGRMTLDRRALNAHTFVCGATGSGKSQTIRHLLEQLSTAPEDPLPWLVVEPAKAEYRRMSGRLAGRGTVIPIVPGATDSVPAGLNPLEPEPGFPLQTHVDLTRALFLAAFQAEEPFPQVLSAALTRCYEELGWDLVVGEARVKGVCPPYPTLGDLQRVAQGVVTGIGYGEEVTRNVRGFVEVRLNSLRHGTPGRFFEGGHPLDIGRLLAENVVFEIQDLGDDRDKAFLMGTVIVRLYEHLRLHRAGPDVPLRHVTVIEEAHRLLRRPQAPGPAAHAVELFASLLSEVRAYGEGIVVAEQIPSKLIPDVIKNTSVKIMHRLPALDDREAVGATMNLTEAQSEYVVSVPRGRAASFAEGMDHPALVQVPLGKDGEVEEGLRHDPPLAGRFSAACGPLCHERSCTLREMRAAQRRLEDDPRIVVWVEVAILAHILGYPSPEPSSKLHTDLGARDRRDTECSIAHAIERSVHLRSGVLTVEYSPAGLAAHLSELLLSQLDGKPLPCGRNDWRFQAGPFRWNRVRFSLSRDWRDSGDGASTGAESRRWLERYGIDVPGNTAGEQLETLNLWVAARTKLRLPVLFGDEGMSPLERSVGCGHTTKEWPDALDATLRMAVTGEQPWLHDYLTPKSSMVVDR